MNASRKLLAGGVGGCSSFLDGKKHVRHRWADEATLQRLLRKYDLNDIVLEQKIKLPEKSKEQSSLEATVVGIVGKVGTEAESGKQG